MYGFHINFVLYIYLFSVMFSAMVFDASSGSDIGIDFRYRTDSSVFNFRRLQAKTKVKTDIVNEFLFADDCALNATTKVNIQNSVDKFSMACDKFSLNISTKKTTDVPASTWKTIHRAHHHHHHHHHHQGTTIEGGRKVHLPRQHPL